MSTRGYLVIAQDNNEHDYLRMAYALGLSIKVSQSTVNQFAVAVTKGTVIPDKYLEVFDHVVTIPWGDHAEEATWKINNKWKYYYMTPFDETVVLDTDMLLTDDISYWWDIMSRKDVWVTSDVKTYKNEIITDDRYRKTFTSNNLPNLYTAFMYFKKTELAAELFQLTRHIFNNWERFFYEFLDETRPTHLSGDVAFALATKILGYENEFTETSNSVMPSFVHMKSMLQNVPVQYLSDDWTQHIPTYFNTRCELKVGNLKQVYPFHYHIKHWLTNDIITKLENKYNG